MLAYLTTDATIAPTLLRKLLQQSVDVSFNTVTVDDHASTNDTAPERWALIGGSVVVLLVLTKLGLAARRRLLHR